jgi:spore maturation protein SpmA
LSVLLAGLLLASLLIAAFTGRMAEVSAATLSSAKQAVELAIGLVGTMTFFLGLMRVASDAGGVQAVARLLSPVLRRLFPEIPPQHPAMGAMVLNLASTALGLGNAATPFGIKAMQDLDEINPSRGTASDPMVLFLAVNTAGFCILPTSILALRASSGSADPAGVLFPIWIASGAATVAGIVAAKALARMPLYRRGTAAEPAGAPGAAASGTVEPPAPVVRTPARWAVAASGVYVAAFGVALALHVVRSAGERTGGEIAREVLSFWVLPALVGGVVLYGWARGVRVFPSLVEGGKEGFEVAIRILPYLVTVLVAVGMFRASGGLDLLVTALSPITRGIGLPAEAIPVALMRPLSGSGSFGLAADVIRVHGPDSLLGYLVSTLYGSTETTFYVLAVYFGAVKVKRMRHALPACLLADAAGVLTAVVVVRILFG